MHASGSYILTLLEKVRFILDEPTLDAKFKDPFLIQYVIGPAMVDVLARLNLNQDNPICVRHSILMHTDTEYYQLPPNVQEIWRFAILDQNGRMVSESYPRGAFNPAGPGWSIQGNLLQIRPLPQLAQTAAIWYIPTGDVQIHQGTGHLRGTRFTLASSPTYGVIDRRPNAYAGATLRLLPATGPIQERIIESHDVASNTVTVRVPFFVGHAVTSSSDDSNVVGSTSSQESGTVSGGFGSSESSSSSDGFSDAYTYEIAPPAISALYEAISWAAALKLGVSKGISEKKMTYMEKEYMKAMKTIKDNLANMQIRAPKSFAKDTVDNPITRFWGA